MRLSCVSGRIALVVPGVEATFTVSEIFAFTSVLLFGPEAGAVTLALDCLVLAWHRRMGLEKAAFTFANLTLAVWTSGTLFFAVSGTQPLLDGGQPTPLIEPLALTYFLVNTGLIAAAIGLETGTGPLVIWLRHFSRLAPGYAASAWLAFLLVVALKQVRFAAIWLLPPVLLLFYYTLRSSFGRVEDAKGHVGSSVPQANGRRRGAGDPARVARNEVLTISSLARAVSGNASLSDVGPLAWVTLRNVVPASAMALFVEDERQDLMTVAHAAGARTSMLRQLKRTRGGGIAGWVAVNRRGVLNARPRSTWVWRRRHSNRRSAAR